MTVPYYNPKRGPRVGDDLSGLMHPCGCYFTFSRGGALSRHLCPKHIADYEAGQRAQERATRITWFVLAVVVWGLVAVQVFA